MKKLSIVIILLFAILVYCSCNKKSTVPIQIPQEAGETLQFAASELSGYLEKIYPGYRFPVLTDRSDQPESLIQLGTIHQIKNELTEINAKGIHQEESFAVIPRDQGVIIAGYGEKGVLNGVYALLEQLGCGFYLAYETLPEQKKNLDFSKWKIQDAPIYKRRIVFNWHNFLSGCTGWNLEHWKKWILQSARMRYNSIMVHAYGNNPMHTFEYNQIQKTTGYLTSTRKGRDWGAQHVNDVRRLYGGELFDQPVFGSNAALVPDSLKEKSAINLMQKVFQYAEKVGMDIYFAVDVDTRSANPQDIIQSLPGRARFSKTLTSIQNDTLTEEMYHFVNPDTPEGYAYYKAQVKSIMETYPQVDVLTPWTRRYSTHPNWLTPWRSLEQKDFPQSWSTAYKLILDKHPCLKSDVYTPSTFAISKILQAYQKAIDELNYDVRIATGSWKFKFLPSASVLFQKDIPLIPLDQDVVFYADSVRQYLAKIGKKHPLIPVVWAHHDDHRYVGKPYTPFQNFADKLKESNSKGFGIIHWTTRPLDLYFKSLGNQVWRASQNEPLQTTIQEYVHNVFHTSNEALKKYIDHWLHQAPMFGRETLDHFMDPGKFVVGEEPNDPQIFIQQAHQRLNLLDQIHKKHLSHFGQEMFDYYKGMEHFFIDFISTHQKLVEANKHWKSGNNKKAQYLIKDANPGKVIEQYASYIQHGELTRGEQALIITLNLQWLPDFLDQKQLLGLEPIRYNFQPTFHDSVAQAPGKYTYYFDEEQDIWLGLGEHEIEHVEASILDNKNKLYDIESTVTKSTKPFILPVRSYRGHPLPKGTYELQFLFPDAIQSSIDVLLLVEGKTVETLHLSEGQRTNSKQIHTAGRGFSLEFLPGKQPVILNGIIIQAK